MDKYLGISENEERRIDFWNMDRRFWQKGTVIFFHMVFS